MSFLSQPITLQTLFGVKRMIGPLTVQVTLSEETTDVLTITKQPVQTGASITDHAYMEPTVFSASILQQNNNTISGLLGTFAGAGNSGLAQIYKQFLSLQSSRTLFNILTPKRIYKNMLMASLRMNTDKRTENILSLGITCQQVLLVSVGTTVIPANQQKNAGVTQATQNVGKQSALLTGAQAISPNTVGIQ